MSKSRRTPSYRRTMEELEYLFRDIVLNKILDIALTLLFHSESKDARESDIKRRGGRHKDDQDYDTSDGYVQSPYRRFATLESHFSTTLTADGNVENPIIEKSRAVIALISNIWKYRYILPSYVGQTTIIPDTLVLIELGIAMSFLMNCNLLNNSPGDERERIPLIPDNRIIVLDRWTPSLSIYERKRADPGAFWIDLL